MPIAIVIAVALTSPASAFAAESVQQNDSQMKGKLLYVKNNNLADSLTFAHQYPVHLQFPGVPLQFPGQPPTRLGRDFIEGNVTSSWRGRPSADFITNNICQNASVELVGTGKIYGVPYIWHLSDLVQTNQDL